MSIEKDKEILSNAPDGAPYCLEEADEVKFCNGWNMDCLLEVSSRPHNIRSLNDIREKVALVERVEKLEALLSEMVNRADIKSWFYINEDYQLLEQIKELLNGECDD